MQRLSTSDGKHSVYPASSVAGDTPYAHSRAPESSYYPTMTAPPATPASVVQQSQLPGTAQTMVISHDADQYAPASPGSDEEAAEHYYQPRRSQLPSY